MAEYKHYYLKVTQKKPVKYLENRLIKLENGGLDFGFFTPYFNSSQEDKWSVLRFDPYSKEKHPKNTKTITTFFIFILQII
jgi:hypothetical protein